MWSPATIATRLWLERVVIGLSLCPWAKPVHERGGVKYAHTRTEVPDTLFDCVLKELDLLSAGDAETTLVVASQAFQDDFLSFNHFVQDVEEYLRQEALDDKFQVVGFHPRFQFADEDASDASNFVNRSPYPAIHLLRQEQISESIDAQPKLAESVPFSNQRMLRKLGAEHMARLLAGVKRDSGALSMRLRDDELAIASSRAAAVPWIRAACSKRRSTPIQANYALADWDDAWWEDGLTCVEYEDSSDGTHRLGVYIKYSIVESEPHIRPLCASASEDGVGSLLCDEEVPPVPLSAVRCVLDPEIVFVSERQAGGGQGLGNPHGEHGEACYDLGDVDISADVTLIIREGRDTERVL
jgi:hypothetical protein